MAGTAAASKEQSEYKSEQTRSLFLPSFDISAKLKSVRKHSGLILVSYLIPAQGNQHFQQRLPRSVSALAALSS